MKFTRTLLAISVLSTAQLVSAQGNKPDTLVQQLLDTHYPGNQKAVEAFNKGRNAEEAIRQCHFRNDKERDDKEEIIAGYCMDFIGEKMVDTAQGRRRYLFFSGENLNHAHLMSGLDSLFVFDSVNGRDWRLLTRKETDAMGGWGWGQATRSIQWLEIGPGLWGVMSKNGFRTGGETVSSARVLYDDNGKIRHTAIPIAFNIHDDFCDPAVTDFCDNDWQDEAGAARELAKSAALRGVLSVRRNLPPEAGFYPLQVTVDGYRGRKITGRRDNGAFVITPVLVFQRQPYLFHYDAAQQDYVMPTDFPIRFTTD